MPVLATPRVVALCEEAAVAALDGRLATQRDVGGHARAARPPHAHGGRRTTVTAEATLERIEGRRLVFTVSVHDRRGLVAAGKVTRVVVDVEHFLDKTR